MARITAEERQQAAQLIEQLRIQKAELQGIGIPDEDYQRGQVKKHAHAVREMHTANLLAQLDITVLDECNIDTGNLKRAGYSNVGLLYKAIVDGAFTLSGFSSEAIVTTTVGVIHDNVYHTVPCLINNIYDLEQSKLLSQVLLESEYRAFRNRRDYLLRKCYEMEDAANTLSSIPGFFGNLFMGRERQNQIMAAINLLSNTTNELQPQIAELKRQLYTEIDNALKNARIHYSKNPFEFAQSIATASEAPNKSELPQVTADLATSAKSLIERLDVIDKYLAKVSIPSESKVKANIKKLIDAQKKQRAIETLSKINIDVLAQGGARVGPLKTAGYTNLGELYDTSPHTLSRIPRVTWSTASNVASAVQDIYRSAFETASCRIDVEQTKEL